jgi:hypothetical protein
MPTSHVGAGALTALPRHARRHEGTHAVAGEARVARQSDNNTEQET